MVALVPILGLLPRHRDAITKLEVVRQSVVRGSVKRATLEACAMAWKLRLGWGMLVYIMPTARLDTVDRRFDTCARLRGTVGVAAVEREHRGFSARCTTTMRRLKRKVVNRLLITDTKSRVGSWIGRR